MAYAASKITAEIQDRVSHVLENLSKLTLDLAKPGLKEEEREAVIQEIETAKKGLNFNTQSAVTILNKEPRELYEQFREPMMTIIGATEEFERERRAKFAEMTELQKRKAEGKATVADLTRADVPPEFYLYQTEATVKVGIIHYKKTVDGACDQDNPLLFDGEISSDLYEGEIIEDPVTGAISLQPTLSNFLRKAQRIGLNREMFDRMVRLFVKNKMANSYGAVRRLEGKALFEAVIALSSYNTMVNDLIRRIETVTREVGAGPETALYEVKSVASEIIRLTIPDITEKQLQKKLESILFRLIPRLISEKSKIEYMAYLKSLRINLGKDASLQERLNFINDIETDPTYAPMEAIKVRKTDVPASLFHSKIFLGTDVEMARPDHTEMLRLEDGDQDITEELFWTEKVNTRSQQQPLGPPLWSHGNVPGLRDPERVRSRPEFKPGPASSSTSSSVAPPQDTFTRALVHSPPLEEKRTGFGSENNGVGGESKGTASEAGSERSGWSRGRETNRRGKGYQSVSPTSGKLRYYRKGSNGSMRSISRDRMYNFDPKRGFTPRSFTKSPKRYYETVEKVPHNRCPKCYRYTGAEVGKSCTPQKCLRYLDTPLTKRNCSICKGGFHREEFCSSRDRQSRSPSVTREGGSKRTVSPGWGFGTNDNKKN